MIWILGYLAVAFPLAVLVGQALHVHYYRCESGVWVCDCGYQR